MDKKKIITKSSTTLLRNAALFCSLAVVLLANVISYLLLKQAIIQPIYYLIAIIDFIAILYLLLFYWYLARSVLIEHRQKRLLTQLNGMIQCTTEPIAGLDQHYRYIHFNIPYQTEFKKLFSKNIAIGMTLEESLIAAPAHRTELMHYWKQALEGATLTETLQINKETYENSFMPIMDENNQVIGASHINRNITQKMQQDKITTELNEKLMYEMQELGIHNEKMTLLIELSDRIQACVTVEEATKVIAMKCKKILHFAEGTLYIMDPIKNILEEIVTWGEPVPHEKMITSDQCWALRKGGIYQVKNIQNDLICEHLIEKNAVPYMCIPLMAQNTIFGLLHLDLSPDSIFLSKEDQILVSAITEMLSLALANIKLRETLRNQSLHDSLTGLYNRRYLEGFLLREMSYAERNHLPLAIVMIDIDHFKQLNDKYGHDAGDLILYELGKIFQTEIRMSDIACRYGGEEFLCVFHDCALEAAKKLVEKLRVKIATLALSFRGQSLDPITISTGIAIYPADGLSPAEIISASDKALYQAKNSGRDKVIAYSEMNH